MARFEFRLPDIGEGIAEAEIVAWHVAVGDVVVEDQSLADLMTDKATVEMESPVAGRVVEIAGEVGDQIPIGSPLVIFEIESEEPDDLNTEAEHALSPTEISSAGNEEPLPATPRASEPQDAAPPPNQPKAPPNDTHDQLPHPIEQRREVLATPAVRERAKALGVDLREVKADGDRIRHADLDAFLRYGSNQGYHAPHNSRARANETIKVIGMRRRIAENMAASKRHIPHFTYVEEIDVTKLEELRGDLNATRGAKPKLTLLPLLITAMCRTLPAFPMLNARYDDEAGTVVRYGAVHIGMATQTDAGLMVPVIRDAQDQNIWQLATEIGRLAEAARTGKITSGELSGSTITLTSLGPLGGIATTPVINRPEVAIIGPNKIVERPMFSGDEIVRAKLMNLSISCDHRVVDGWDAASYVQALKKLLETPVLLFAD
ncbi:dihydrolipoamide acetyltransferase family protein [Stakelama pacifica]|uniref:Dihydrolipoamide acetyltransferase component of pyruvate dehydrogenase complex n=1 Tax=Stakelama pacifica TaxID=517720 RepID=A0A4R6FDA1_9SPHN|nr:dihydrolipoamide acetyltransferase family protein [Stakelama pacifica]TDN78245.1 2-oxoisovalerate dehydrogenase E2 component (dihydrolipoyl transacylase) [Stakelama pacifica]GGO99821.1 lipoamide acyltransferase component of branched-chain alpha-keto acid dehydrogenase complex [Stakelama pacifica]